MEKCKCSKEDEIINMKKKVDETHKIITGNGTPESGLIYQFVVISERQNTISDTLKKIDLSLDGLNAKYDETISVATLAKNAIDKYKAEESAYEEGRKIVNVEKERNLLKVVQIIGLVIAIFTFVFSQYKIVSKIKSTEEIIQQIDKEEKKETSGQGILYNNLYSLNLFNNLEAKIR